MTQGQTRSNVSATDTHMTDITTAAILTTDLTGINTVVTTGYTAELDGGGATWVGTGNTGTPGSTSLENGVIYDLAGNEFKIDARGVIDVRQYGADDSGVTAAQEVLINNAIDFLADSTPTGGIVDIGPGDYLIDDTVLPRSNIWLRGSGPSTSKITASAAFPAASMIDGINVDNTNISVSGLHVDMDLATNGGHTVRFSDGTSDLRLFDLFLDTAQHYGIGMQAATVGFKRIWIDRVFIKDAGGDGIDFKDPADDNDEIFISNIIVDGHSLITDSQAGIDIRGIASLENIQVNNVNNVSPSAPTGIRFRSSSFFGEDGATGRKSTLNNFHVQGTAELGRGLNISGRHNVVSNGVVEMSGSGSRGVIITASGLHTFAPGDVSGNVVTIVAHGFGDDHGPVFVEEGTTLPSGLTAQTPYWISVLTDDTFSFLDAPSGSVITLSDGGTGTTTITEVANDNMFSGLQVIGSNRGLNPGDNSLRTSVFNCEFFQCGIGLVDQGVDTVVDGCRFEESADNGISVFGESLNLMLSGNKFNNNTDIGIDFAIAGSAGTVLLDNSFRGNGVAAVRNTLGSDAVYQNNHGIPTPTAITPAATILLPPASGLFRIAADASAIPIENITITFDGDRISLIFVGVSTLEDTSTSTGNVILAGSVDFVSTADDTVELRCDGVDWFEISRSLN